MNKFNETLTNLNDLTVGEITQIIKLAELIKEEKEEKND